MSKTIHNKGQQEQEPKSQRGLWMICGGLAGLLAIVNIPGSADDEDEEAVADIVVPAETATESQTLPTSSANATDRVQRGVEAANWPTFSVESLLKNNPFQDRKPVEEPDPEPESPEEPQESQPANDEPVESPEEIAIRATAERLDGFQSRDVRLVFHGPDGATALVGDTLVHEGDTIEGLQVVRILPNGIVVQAIQGE